MCCGVSPWAGRAAPWAGPGAFAAYVQPMSLAPSEIETGRDGLRLPSEHPAKSPLSVLSQDPESALHHTVTTGLQLIRCNVFSGFMTVYDRIFPAHSEQDTMSLGSAFHAPSLWSPQQGLHIRVLICNASVRACERASEGACVGACVRA